MAVRKVFKFPFVLVGSARVKKRQVEKKRSGIRKRGELSAEPWY
jgi:hypothetical protein